MRFGHAENASKKDQSVFLVLGQNGGQRFLQSFLIFRRIGFRQKVRNNNAPFRIDIKRRRIRTHKRTFRFVQTGRKQPHPFFKIFKGILERKRRRCKSRTANPRIKFFRPIISREKRNRTQNRRMRIAGFFHVEHPIFLPCRNDKSKIFGKAAHFHGDSFQISSQQFKCGNTAQLRTNVFRNRFHRIARFQNRLRVCIIFRKNSPRKTEALRFIFEYFFPEFHEKAM